MRKQTKLVAVLSAAALLAIGASMTSFAATPHWDQEDGEWVYLDRNGDKVTGEWKKSNGQWYYLDDDGFMAKDLLIDYNNDRYYVDENGVKVTNAWVSMDNDDMLDDDDISTVWLYFDNNGKALGYDEANGEIKKLSYGDGQSAYFIFDDEGYMMTGWYEYNDNLYYLGDENEGWARTGWQYLDPDDEDIFTGNDDDDPYEDEEWFWFDSKGKAARGKNKQISGKWYAFNADGVMQDKWVYGSGSNITGDDTANSVASRGDANTKARYHEEDNGGRDKNWVLAYASNDEDDYDDDLYWFYLDSKGEPTVATGEGTGIDYSDKADGSSVRTVVGKSIKNKTYIFDDAGRMRTGLFFLDNVEKGGSGSRLDNGYYYFTEDEGSTEGQMVTNKKMTIEIDDEDTTYYFRSNGRAYTNTIISSALYGPNGQLVDDFGDGSSYEWIEWNNGDVTEKGGSTAVIQNGDRILLNGNGKIRKTGTVTDVDGNKVTVKDYKVTKIEDGDKNVIWEKQ